MCSAKASRSRVGELGGNRERPTNLAACQQMNRVSAAIRAGLLQLAADEGAVDVRRGRIPKTAGTEAVGRGRELTPWVIGEWSTVTASGIANCCFNNCIRAAKQTNTLPTHAEQLRVAAIRVIG